MTDFRTHDGRTLEQAASDLVSREVLCCMSGVVSTLAQCDTSHFDRRGGNQQAEMIDQAVELCSPVLDYEEGARNAGWSGPDAQGLWTRPDGRWRSASSAEEACEASCADPYEWEVFEHWAVSSWLAEKLAAAGERVDTDFAGLNVWARTTTGQSISMDGVIQRIAADVIAA